MHGNELESKEKILKAAKREFAENGFNGTRLDAIAKGAGVNKALIHYYFGNKESLYQEVRMRILGQSGRRRDVMAYMPRLNLTSRQKLFIIIYFLVRVHQRIKDKDVFRIFMREIIEGSKLHEEASRLHRIPQSRFITEILREGAEKGEMDAPDPKLFAMMILSFLDMQILESELDSDGEIYRELYGGADEAAILSFVMRMIFRCVGRGDLQAPPEVPAELIDFTNSLVESVVMDIEEGYVNTAMEKLGELLK